MNREVSHSCARFSIEHLLDSNISPHFSEERRTRKGKGKRKRKRRTRAFQRQKLSISIIRNLSTVENDNYENTISTLNTIFINIGPLMIIQKTTG